MFTSNKCVSSWSGVLHPTVQVLTDSERCSQRRETSGTYFASYRVTKYRSMSTAQNTSADTWFTTRHISSLGVYNDALWLSTHQPTPRMTGTKSSLKKFLVFIHTEMHCSTYEIAVHVCYPQPLQCNLSLVFLCGTLQHNHHSKISLTKSRLSSSSHLYLMLRDLVPSNLRLNMYAFLISPQTDETPRRQRYPALCNFLHYSVIWIYRLEGCIAYHGPRTVCKQTEQDLNTISSSSDGDNHGRSFFLKEERFIAQPHSYDLELSAAQWNVSNSYTVTALWSLRE